MAPQHQGQGRQLSSRRLRPHATRRRRYSCPADQATHFTAQRSPCQQSPVRPSLFALGAPRGLTRRSSGRTTALRSGRQALGLRPILRLPSSPQCRCAPLSSNVRAHQGAVSAKSVGAASTAQTAEDIVFVKPRERGDGSIEATTELSPSSNGLSSSIRAGLKPASPKTRGRRPWRRSGSPPQTHWRGTQSLVGSQRRPSKGPERIAPRSGGTCRKMRTTVSALACTLRDRQNQP